MKFLVDEQLPLALVRALNAANHDARHIFEVRLGGMPDEQIWRRACSEARVIITRDADFVRIQSRDAATSGRVLWVRLGNCTNPVLLAAIIPNLESIVGLFERGEWLIEVA